MSEKLTVEEFTLPPAGTDVTEITIEEHYAIEGVGEDTVRLTGTLVSDRAEPLLGDDSDVADWDNGMVVAQFTHLDVRGESEVFGPVLVQLDRSSPSFGVVEKGKCKATLGILVSMPRHGLTLRTAEPVQLRSQVRTVPPVGDEKTVSRRPVDLQDRETLRTVGSIHSARVIWRELAAQTRHFQHER